MLYYLKALLIYIFILTSSAFSQEDCDVLCSKKVPSGGKGLSGKKLKKSLGDLEEEYIFASDWSPLKSSSPGYKSDKELEKNAVNSVSAQL